MVHVGLVAITRVVTCDILIYASLDMQLCDAYQHASGTARGVAGLDGHSIIPTCGTIENIE